MAHEAVHLMAAKKQGEGNTNKPGVRNPEGLASCDQPTSAASHLRISWTYQTSSSAVILVCKQEPVKGILYLNYSNIKQASIRSEKRYASKIYFLHIYKLGDSRSRCQQNTPVLARIDSWFAGKSPSLCILTWWEIKRSKLFSFLAKP